MIVKKLNGHSGCEVYLMREEHSFVRKISSDVEYNQRLVSQMNKQGAFRNSTLKTPQIFNSGFMEDKFYFDMEYIRGSNFHEFVQKENISNVKSKFATVIDFIETNTDLNESVKKDIQSKINNLQIDSQYDRYRDYCLDFDWNKIYKSYCHGDLTFENLIISGDEIYVIDFLDSFVDTKIMDYAKIFQELYCFWSYRELDKNFNIKYIILDQMIQLDNFKKQASLKLLTLNLLRILPYANEHTTQFVDYQLKYVTKGIDGQ